MKKILVSCPIFPDVIERLRQYFDVIWHNDAPLPTDELARQLADKEGLLTDSASGLIGMSVLSSAPALRVVANMAVGYNNFDIPAFNASGVLATNTPDVLTEATADFGWALMMAAARRITESEHWLRAGCWGKWRYDSFLGGDLFKSTLGIIGLGRIGQALARRASGFNMRVVYHNRSRVSPAIEAQLGAEYLSKEELLGVADHVVLVLPYSAENHHAIGANELALMKRGATLTSIARGGIVDDVALAVALREKWIAAAGLDVFENEPHVCPALLDIPNIVMTPHIASATETTRRAMANLAADNLIAGLGEGPHAGFPPNPINLEVWGRTAVSLG